MWIVADVVWDTDPEAREAQRLVRENRLAGISVDPGNLPDAIIEVLGENEDGSLLERIVFTNYQIGGATLLPIPAFEDSRIEVTEAGQFVAYLVPEGIETGDHRMFEAGSVSWRENAVLMWNDTNEGHQTARAVGNLVNFRRSLVAVACPAEWKADPELPRLTKPKVEDGRIMGHGAGWGTCHTGFKNACVTAPASQTAYSHIGETVNIYQHPAGDIHAPLGLDAERTRAWYDAHCTLVGQGGVGEDGHGIWISGATELDDGELFLSGDWRDIDGNLELISFLVVKNPGFPTALVASEHQMSLVGAGIVSLSEMEMLRLEVSALSDEVSMLKLEREAEQLIQSLLS